MNDQTARDGSPPTTEHLSVPADQYDATWIEQTWGWDTPEEFVATQGANLRPRIVEALDLAQIEPGMRVLDIGCGRGEVVLECARRGIHALGVDYSSTVIDLANKTLSTLPEEVQQRATFACGELQKLELDGPYDRIFMLDFVEHLYDWQLDEVFRACHEILAEDGALVIHTLPNRWLYEITYRRLVRLAMPWLPANPRSEKEMSIHVNEMTITHLHKLLETNGYHPQVWLKDMTVEQAAWHHNQPLNDRRHRLYRWLTNPLVGGFVKAVSKTPFKLLTVNDIFAVASKRAMSLPMRVPSRRTEQLMIRLAA
mgnify:CR=1 FL=1